MGILSNVLGGDQDSSSNSDSSAAGVLQSATDLGVSYEANSSDMNEDGETTSSHDDGAFGTDLNTGNLLGGASDSSSDSSTDSDGGSF
ncbi:MAG TPA: hypothetical protein VF633_02735 [Brevundimonas sp.]|jgi:hypothetical protein